MIRAWLFVAFAAAAILGLIALVGTAPAAAGVVAVVAAVLLAFFYVRGAQPFFAYIAGDHPDALGSLDERERTGSTP